jgi:hypothetical protein
MLIVAHAVPLERVRLKVPPELQLDTVKGPEGEEFALVTMTCFLNRDLQWLPSGEENFDFHQAVFGTYVRYGEESGVYIIGNFLERGTPLVFERMIMKNSYAADFDISLGYDEENRSYGHYYCEVLSSKGDTVVEVTSAGDEPTASLPFKSGNEMLAFMTQRHVQYFLMIGGGIGKIEMDFGATNPVNADLLNGEFGYWEDLDILREEEFEDTYAVLIQPSIEMMVHAPKAC